MLQNKIRDFGNYTYPEDIISYTMAVISTLDQDGFFEEEEIDHTIFFETLCDKVLINWIAGNDLQLTQEEMIEVIANSATQTVLESLKGKGMLYSIKGEDGEERFFLTPDGREVANMILDEQKNAEDNNLNKDK